MLQYDGLGTSVPSDVDARLASHWVIPVSLGRQLAAIREHGYRVVRLYDAWAPHEEGERSAMPSTNAICSRPAMTCATIRASWPARYSPWPIAAAHARAPER